MIDFQPSNFPNDFTWPSVYESARLSENLDGGGITISWNSDDYKVLPVGASIIYNGTKYSLLDPYAPTQASPLHYRYEPTFQHPIARLSRVPFYIKSTDAEHNNVNLYTSYFTGYPRTIADKLASFFNEYGDVDDEFKGTFGAWTAEFEGSKSNVNTVITVNFDGCSIKAAAARIADAIGCNVFFDWPSHVIRFVVGSSLDGETYNCFRVLGGTTNMAKRTISGMLAPVTHRLTLPSEYADSMMVIKDANNQDPSIRLTTDIILDDIYPKMELEITNTLERQCYLTDDDGKKIVDHYEDASGNPVSPETENAQPVYKLYSKWYVQLSYTNGSPYVHNIANQIQDKPLSLLFQPDYTNTKNTCPLAGRQFELVYFPDTTQEWDDDDVLPKTNAFHVPAGWFRIIFAADGDTILPSTREEMLIPQKQITENGVTYRGNIVTLVNVGLEETYTTIAQNQLKTEGEKIVALYAQQKASYNKTVIGSIPTIGSAYNDNTLGNGIVTNINADLDTGVAEISVGSWTRKTLTAGIRDKIDAISVTNSSPTTVTGETGVSKNQFDALWKTTKKPSIDTEALDALGTDLEAIKAQNDAKFDVIFGYGIPTNSNEPAVTWIAEGSEEEHVQDIYYNTAREGAEQGGRAYRWNKVGTNSNGNVVKDSNNVPVEFDAATHAGFTYMWVQITDMDTNASLERIADVSSDSIITGGAEKTRVFLEWRNADEQYKKVIAEASKFSAINVVNGSGSSAKSMLDEFKESYWVLWNMLDGVSYGLPSLNYEPANIDGGVPSWFKNGNEVDLTHDTKLSDSNKSPVEYRTAWDDFYAQLAAITMAMTGENRTIVTSSTSFFVSANVPSLPYKVGDMWLRDMGYGDYELYICTTTPGKTASESDWEKIQSYGVSVTNLLADLAVKLMEYTKEWYTNDFTSFGVYIQSESSRPTASKYVWVKLSGTTASLEITGVAQTSITNSSEIIHLIAQINSITKKNPIVVYFETPSSATKYDLVVKYNTYHDNFTNRDLEGSLGVWVYDGQMWVKILDDTTGMIQNFGDAIVMAVTGSDEVNPNVNHAAGIATTKNFATIFAQAVDETEEGETTALAAISTIIARDPVTHEPTGKILLTAEQVQIDASDLDLRAEDITFSSGGTLLNLQENLVTLLIDNLGYQTTGATDTQALQQQLGMVIRKNGSGSGEFSFGTFVNGTFVAGINFITENNKTKLNLTADNAKIDADLVSVIASQVSVNASNIDFTSQTIDMSSATSINLNATTINLDAEKITWKGHDIIPSGSGSSYNPATASYFYVSNSGNVTMDSATIKGAITANTGYIGGTSGWVIESQRLYSGTIGTDASMHLATTNLTGTIAGQNLSTWRFTVGSKFGVTSDGKLYADGATITNINASGSITLPSDKGKFTYSEYGQFGLYMNSREPFTTSRTDYLKGSTDRGAILRIEQINQDSSFRGLFCDGEVEIIGITQLLRTPNADFTVDALIVEGIDNKRAIKTVGVVNSGRNVRHTVSVDTSTYSVTDYDDIIFLSSSSKQTVTFPSNPETGREIWIRNIQGTAEINFNGKNATGNSPGTISNTDKWHIYIYRGDVWFYGYTN